MTSGLFRDLSPLLSPQGIAVVGASERPGSAGRLVLENLRTLGYAGKVYAVHPSHQSVLGFPCYPDLKSLPEPVDMAAVLIGADKALSTLEMAASAGIRAAWVLASGYSESGPEGEARQAELTSFAEKTGLLVCGPNCIGVADLVGRSATYSVALSPRTTGGRVSAVMQSGAICLGLANAARFGFRYLISSGNEAVLDSADYIGYLAGDPQTQIIIAFLEGIRKPQKFIAAARAARQAGKPLLVVKVGRSEVAQRAVQAHTGSLAGSDVVLDAVFKREGILRFNTLDELQEAAELFLNCPLPETDGVGLLSLSGGQIGLVADLAENLGLEFPPFSEAARKTLSQILPPYTKISNPLDAWGTGDLEKNYPGCVEAVAGESHISLIAVTRDTPPGVAEREVEQSIKVVEAAIKARRETGKPALVFSNLSTGFEPAVQQLCQENGVPYLQGTAETLRAIQAFEDYAAFQRNAGKDAVIGSGSPADVEEWRKKLRNQKGSLSEVEGRKLLAAYGIPGPRELVAADEGAAVRAAGEIGYPLVLKILSPDIQHKTEIGGVRVGLNDLEAVRTAYGEVITAARRAYPQAKIEGVVLQEMIPSGAVEVILGIIKDKDFGPVIVFGSGGVLVELVKDSALRLPPLSKAEARTMIGETRGFKLLKGFRGQPEADIDALVDALSGLSQLALDLGDLIAALDINPLMVLPKGKGVRAVDALVELAS